MPLGAPPSAGMGTPLGAPPPPSSTRTVPGRARPLRPRPRLAARAHPREAAPPASSAREPSHAPLACAARALVSLLRLCTVSRSATPCVPREPPGWGEACAPPGKEACAPQRRSRSDAPLLLLLAFRIRSDAPLFLLLAFRIRLASWGRPMRRTSCMQHSRKQKGFERGDSEFRTGTRNFMANSSSVSPPMGKLAATVVAPDRCTVVSSRRRIQLTEKMAGVGCCVPGGDAVGDRLRHRPGFSLGASARRPASILLPEQCGGEGNARLKDADLLGGGGWKTGGPP